MGSSLSRAQVPNVRRNSPANARNVSVNLPANRTNVPAQAPLTNSLNPQNVAARVYPNSENQDPVNPNEGRNRGNSIYNENIYANANATRGGRRKGKKSRKNKKSKK